jgi:hypothetical protein
MSDLSYGIDRVTRSIAESCCRLGFNPRRPTSRRAKNDCIRRIIKKYTEELIEDLEDDGYNGNNNSNRYSSRSPIGMTSNLRLHPLLVKPLARHARRRTRRN